MSSDCEKIIHQLKKTSLPRLLKSLCKMEMILPVFLRFEEHKYTGHSSNGAYSDGCGDSVKPFIQGVPDKTGEDQYGYKCEYDRHNSYSHRLSPQFVLRPMSEIHLLFRHCYNSLRSTWNDLIVFSQIFRLWKWPRVMLLLKLDGRSGSIGRFCIFHKLFLCRFQRSASLGPYSRHLFFGGIYGISQWDFYPKRRNTVCHPGIHLSGFSCRIL